MKRLFVGILLISVLILIGNSSAQAHKVTIFAWAEGGQIHTESKFSGGKRVKGGTVTVLDLEGNQLLEGQTDANGEFSFHTPAANGLILVLKAGMGHRNSWTLSAADLGAPGADSPEAAAASLDAKGTPGPKRQTNPGGLSAADVEAIVARQLEAKLSPLIRMVAASQDKGPTASDIFGGLGYILGLVGLGAYVRYRKGNRSS